MGVSDYLYYGEIDPGARQARHRSFVYFTGRWCDPAIMAPASL
jgi:hypothetical protein